MFPPAGGDTQGHERLIGCQGRLGEPLAPVDGQAGAGHLQAAQYHAQWFDSDEVAQGCGSVPSRLGHAIKGVWWQLDC